MPILGYTGVQPTKAGQRVMSNHARCVCLWQVMGFADENEEIARLISEQIGHELGRGQIWLKRIGRRKCTCEAPDEGVATSLIVHVVDDALVRWEQFVEGGEDAIR